MPCADICCQFNLGSLEIERTEMLQARVNKKKFSHKKQRQSKQIKQQRNNKLSKLQQNDAEINKLTASYAQIDVNSIKKFSDFPLSRKTLKALNAAKYIVPTEVQRLSIGHALQGKDVLGAAITGSGKTLAFLIPVLEHLFVQKWSRTDGIGAIIISPTRELAYQIFETLKKVGKEHDFSAGLIIGGKNLKFERSRMDQCNILICTPGRLLQHMDENPLFNATTMEMLVLDEADRCLDMGFAQTLNAIIENFSPERQTLLFSATQTNSVEDLARLKLKQPVYVGCRQQQRQQSRELQSQQSTATVNEHNAGAVLAVPELLQQSYIVLPLEEKVTMLWSFIKNHLRQKIIVFLSSCKQVKYIYEIFCKLRPGTSLLALYGTLHQDRRIAIYEDFVRKSNVVLFATDVASRGLDFPAINWVVQLDCPEDVAQYIHRAGRSARNKTRGESLLVLLPSEEEHMINALKEQQIIIKYIQIDPKKLFSPRLKIEAFLAQFPELKATAQRAFQAYIKSVFLMRNKRVFNILSLDFDAYAKSLGLAITPRVPFLERFIWRQKQAKQIGNEPTSVQQKNEPEFRLSNNKYLSEYRDDDDDDDDDLLKIKRRDHEIITHDDEQKHNVVAADNDHNAKLLAPKREKLITKAALAKRSIKKKLQINTKLKFNEDGEEIPDERKQMKALTANPELLSDEENRLGGIDILRSKQLLSEEDKYDKQRFRELVKKRHKLMREKLKKKTTELEVNNESDNDVDMNDDDNDDDASSVDLSWLPDPDKIYNKTSKVETQTSDSSATETDDSVEDADVAALDEPKRKRMKITEKLSLNDTEAIAATLLGYS